MLDYLPIILSCISLAIVIWLSSWKIKVQGEIKQIEYSKILNYFPTILSGISLVIAVLALIFAFADIRINAMNFEPDHFLAVIGAIMASIGFVLGIYFALLAVKAYGDIREIEKQAISINTHHTNIVEINSSINSIHDYQTANYINILNSQIYLFGILKDTLNENNPNHKRRLEHFSDRIEDATRLRARTCYQFPYFEDGRVGRFSELGGLGDKTDLPYLQKIVDLIDESDEIKGYAQEAIKNIKDRIKSEDKKD